MKKRSGQPLIKRLKTLTIGKALNPFDPKIFHRLSLIALFAWVGLGSDALSSSSYGPAEAFITLGQHAYLAVFVALGTVLTIIIISSSYSQITELFPNGGGGYLVASKLLSPTLGMVSGCALLIDYILTITLSIASGVEALFSFLPAEWKTFQLLAAVMCVLIILLLNLRGVKESVMILMPIFLLFVVTHLGLLAYAFADHFMNFPKVATGIVVDSVGTVKEIGLLGLVLLVLRSYSMGAGTYTGLEAVSNGIPILREPKVQTAKRTMKLMAASLIFMVIGLMICYLLYDVVPQEGKTLNAVLFENITAGWGMPGYYLVILTLVSEAALLFVAAQTGFLDGPRVLANMAVDRWVPTRFATLSDRLVTQNGILIMGGSALTLMILAGGSVSFLLVLYSITVFVTFSLSQAGMVRYWWKARSVVKNWNKKIMVNGLGFVMTSFILISMIYVKFDQGGWITLLITGAMIAIVIAVRSHYNRTAQLIKKLNMILPAAEIAGSDALPDMVENSEKTGVIDHKAKTAVLLVNGFNGTGIYTLSSIFKSFGDSFKNFLFIEVGVIDAGTFKGEYEMKSLRTEVNKELDHYVSFMKQRGYYAESLTAVGIDVVEEITKMTPDILKRFPNTVFFGGQIIFPRSTRLSKWLHNYTLLSLEKRLSAQGVQLHMVPIKVE